MNPSDDLLCLFKSRVFRHLYLVKDGVIEKQVFVCIIYVLCKVIQYPLNLHQNVHHHQLMGVDCLVVVAIVVEVVPALEKLAYLHTILLRVADLVAIHPHVFD